MKLLIAALAFFATSAFAVGIGNDNPPGGGGGVQAQNQGQAQGQIQGQAQGQGQAQFSNADSRSRALASVYVAPADVSLTVNEAEIPANTRLEQAGKVEIRNVPNVFGGNVYPTAPCMGSSTIGGAGVGFGVSIGSSWTDDECGIRETARSFNTMGMKEDAVKVLCASKYAAAAPACQK
jgi:hypothetical protein